MGYFFLCSLNWDIAAQKYLMQNELYKDGKGGVADEAEVSRVYRAVKLTPEELPSEGDSYPAEDIEKGKTMAGLSYLLFFLPLVACHESKYAKFHANQALLLLITAIAGNVMLGRNPIVILKPDNHHMNLKGGSS